MVDRLDWIDGQAKRPIDVRDVNLPVPYYGRGTVPGTLGAHAFTPSVSRLAVPSLLEAKVFWGKTGDLLESPPPNQVFGPARDVFGARLGSRTQPSC